MDKHSVKIEINDLDYWQEIEKTEANRMAKLNKKKFKFF